jgi:beta-glucosidase-like glycosyl hydrolase
MSTIHGTARLLFPAIRWDYEAGSFDAYRPTVERGRERGVGGYILFGGPAAEVRELIAELRAGSPHPLLIGADLERGAGQQFEGAVTLPPPGALASLDDPSLTRRAGELTAREARALGIDWVYAPVADLDLEARNPIVGSRAFGSDPVSASRHVRAWIEGCRAGGALTCAKHFPGHGRTTADSHLQLPSVDVPASALEADLAPFRAAIEAQVDSVMTAHVAYPAYDPSGAPATLSRPILTGLLRERLGFEGIVVTDALIMEGVQGPGGTEGDAAVRAVAAGCDALLYPRDLDRVASALAGAAGTDRLPDDRTAEAVARVQAAADAMAERASAREDVGDAVPGWGAEEDRAWALWVASRAIGPLRGEPRGAPAIELLTVDDDAGGPFAVRPRRGFAGPLRDAGMSVRVVEKPTGALPLVVALYADIRGFKGRPGLSRSAIGTLGAAVARARSATVVLFGHPRLAPEVPGERLLGAWGGEPLMEEAAARWLAG